MKLLYKPLAMITRAIAARLGRSTFRSLWSRIDDREPPGATRSDATLVEVMGAAVLEAATMAAFAALADRTSAQAFHYLFGVWPGEDPPEPGQTE